MKSVVSILLIVLFVPLFLIGVLAATLRFQVLNSIFWLNTFSKNNVYANIATVVKKSAEDKTVKEGGSKNDIELLTNLVTTQNIQDGVDRNLKNLLNFVNGESGELDVYIPFDKIPKDLLPTTFDDRSNTIPLSTVLRSLNFRGIDSSQISMISGVGFWSWILLIADLILIISISLLFYLLVERGMRLWNIGTGLFLSGTVLIATYILGEGIRKSMITQWPDSPEAIQRILATFTPFIFQDILSLWLVTGISAVIIGIILFLVVRPMYNKRK